MCQTHMTAVHCAHMTDEATRIGQRLREARMARGFASAAEAARRFHWNITSYQQAENGTRPPSRTRIAEYARKLKVSVNWLLTGAGTRDDTELSTVPMIGFVGADALVTFLGGAQRMQHEVLAPPKATARTVALEIRGDSLRKHAQDGWLVYYEDHKEPMSESLLDKLCVIGLSDGSVMVRKIQKGSRSGLFHLLSSETDPVFDQKIIWASEIVWLKPR